MAQSHHADVSCSHKGRALSSLTRQQRRVLDLLLQFKTYDEIAEELQLPHLKVERGVVSAKVTLGARSGAELVLIYRDLLQKEVRESGPRAMASSEKISHFVGSGLRKAPAYLALQRIPRPSPAKDKALIDREALSSAILAAPAWARAGITMPDEQMRLRAAEELATTIAEQLGRATHEDCDEQLRLPI